MLKNKVFYGFLILALLLPLMNPGSQVSGEQITAAVQTTITIEDVADATVRSSAPMTNFGSESDLELSYTGREEQAAIFLRFDTSSIPRTAVIDSAILGLFLEWASGETTVSIPAYFVASSWDESTVTWNSIDYSIGKIVPTGDINSVTGIYKAWSMPGYVQTWVNNPSSNNGVLLLGPDDVGSYVRWFPSHDSNEYVPQLKITYHMPVLSGRVYEGEVGDETTPIAGVNLNLYCSNNAGVLGTQIGTTTTNPDGWYGFDVTDVCEYYQIVETDPEGYTSVGATSVGGDVINPNLIEYSYPLVGKTFTGNKFWDIVPERELHIFSGPTVSDITTHSAVINWQTDEVADSHVGYDTLARLFRFEVADPTQTTNHEVLLAGLTPSTTYHFKVRSSDDVGNSAESEDFIFETLPASDSRDPTVRIIDPGIVRETVKFQADAEDDTGVKKVEFFWDGKPIFTDYSPPYEWELSTGAEDNGDHDLKVKVFDFSGRSEIDEKMVKVFNFIDKEAPQVKIFHPYDGADVYGSTPVWVTVSDDSGWSNVELFVDGVKVTGGSFPVSPALNIKFWWNTTVYPKGSHYLAVKATDDDGKEGTDVINITVANPTSPPQPNLVVTKHEVFRHAHTFAIELTVENKGDAKASQVEIVDSLTGFQAIARHFNGVDYETEYDTNLKRTNVTIKDMMGLAPGSSRTYIIAAVPVLTHPNPPWPAIGSEIKLAYTGPTGSKYSKPVLAFEVFKTTQTAGSAPSEPLAQALANAVKTSSYLIVTDPEKLFAHNPNQDNDQVLSVMAELAFVREGVLGFLGGSNTDTMLDNLIEPGGNWAKALNSNFGKVGQGYLLIVGEVEIVPAWREPLQLICESFQVSLSDLRYADTGGSSNIGAPELILGRIIGNDALDLVNAIQNNITGSFDSSHYLLVSGIDGGDPNSFVTSINEIDKQIACETCVTKFHMDNIDSGDEEDTYKNNTVDKDVIVYQGHGNVDSWHGLSTDQILLPTDPLSFGSTNPVVLSITCLTGSYENHVQPEGCPSYGGGDDNIAEAFLDQGAAVFIGSTEGSVGWYNRPAAEGLFGKWWILETSAGKALFDLKRAILSPDPYAQLWVYEYNLYGDPKYGERDVVPIIFPPPFYERLPMIDLIIPDYEVVTVGEFHEVEIPGGEVMLELGGYRIPYYSTTITYPPGYEVQQVSMINRSGLVTVPNSGFNIPINEMLIAQGEAQDQDSSRVGDGWVPEEEFDWRIMEDPDGTITLTINMYPFYYDPATTDVEFYKNYSFDIDFIVSPVTLTSMVTDKEVYVQNELVQADVMLTNTEASQDVSVGAVIYKYPSGEFVTGLPLQSLDSLMNDASFGLTWDTDGFETGSYMIEVTLKNAENQVLDRITTTFQVGITSGEILQMDVTPQYFEIGDSIDVSLTFENTGSVHLSGTLHIKVYDQLGTLVEDYEKPFSDLAPGVVIDHDAVWNSSGAERGDYGIVGYARYAGKTSEAVQIIISTEQPGVYFLPLILLNAE